MRFSRHRRTPAAHADPWAAELPTPPAKVLGLVAIGVIVVLAIAVAALAGWAVSDKVAPERPTAAAPDLRVAEVGGFRLTVDGGWRPIAPPPEASAAGLSDAQAFLPVAGAPATAWIAQARTDDPSLVPAALRELVQGELPPRAKVRVAGRQAWAYRGLETGPGRLTNLTVAPAAGGVLVIGCSSPESWWAASSGCAAGIHSIAGATAVAPSSELAARDRLPEVVSKLNAERRDGRRALRAARRPQVQARAAQSLAAAHRSAVRRLSGVVAGGTVGHRVQIAFRRMVRSYDALAEAARNGWPRRYRMARADVRRAEGAARRALAAAQGR